MITKFIAQNGVEVEGEVLYESPIYRGKDCLIEHYDEIVFAQNRIAKIHHTLDLCDDGDNYEDNGHPEITILKEYVTIEE